MSIDEFVREYGHLWVYYVKYDGLYWFRTSENFFMAVEFPAPEYDPGRVISIDKFNFIKDNIVAAIIQGKKYIFNHVYVKHIEDFKC
jgi:hypothetical protein